MFQGQYIFGDGTTFFSPWMQRQGDNILVTAEALSLQNATLDVEVWTKNSEDPGDGGNASSTSQKITLSAVGRTSDEWVGELLELVRYKFTLAAGDPGDFVCFRMLDPVWFDDVVA